MLFINAWCDIPGLDIAECGPSRKTRWKFPGAETVMDNQDLAEQKWITSILAAEMTLDPSQDENPRNVQIQCRGDPLAARFRYVLYDGAMFCPALDLGMKLCQCLKCTETTRRAGGRGRILSLTGLA